jgi:hypothetical protein
MANMTNSGRMRGVIDQIHEHTFTIIGDDGERYFAYRRNLDSFTTPFTGLVRLMQVSFLPVGSDRAKDDARAIEIKVIAQAPRDGV